MTYPATLISPTTRSGSRRPVPWLNQPWRKGKAEPSRSTWATPWLTRSSASPDQNGTPSVPVESEASSLLVILHYLLKNNTTFMWGYEQGQLPPEGGGLASSDGRTAPPSPEGGRGV